MINPGFLLSPAVEVTRPPFSLLSSSSWEPRWHSSHFLDNSHNAVGGYSNKGGTAPGYKTLKATDDRDSSGCATIHGFARIETNKGRRESRRHFRAGLRIASDLSRGMQECAIITQRCGSTVLSTYAGCAISPGSFSTRSGQLLILVGKSALL